MGQNGINIVETAKFFPLTRNENPFSALSHQNKPRFYKLTGENAKRSLAVNSLKNDEDSLKKSCDDFEAILVNFLMNQMRKTVKKNNLFGEGGFANETYTSMLDSEVSKAIAQSGALNISNSLYNQFTNGIPVKDNGFRAGESGIDNYKR